MTRIYLVLVLLFCVAELKAKTYISVIKDRGHLTCGVTTGLEGFSKKENNKWVGFDVDICRSIATAIFNDPDKVKYIPLNAGKMFGALDSGQVDILSRVTTFNFSRDMNPKRLFLPIVFFDSQGLLVHQDSKVKTATDLKGKSICTQKDTTSEANAFFFFKEKKIDVKFILFDEFFKVKEAFGEKKCDAITSDLTGLAGVRVSLGKDKYRLVDLQISKEPLAPVVRFEDKEWVNLAKWSIYALIFAEELGVSSANLNTFLKSENIKVRRFLGTSGNLGKKLGVERNWIQNIISKVGNYQEIYDRNLGKSSPLNLERGYNHTYLNKGLLYAPPFQ